MNYVLIVYIMYSCKNFLMSAEKNYLGEQSASVLTKPEVAKDNFSGRVDINILIARVRSQEKKEYKTNLVFFSLFSAVVLVMGIILSF